MVILTSIAKVLIGLFIIALVLAFITAIFLLGAIVATLGTILPPMIILSVVIRERSGG